MKKITQVSIVYMVAALLFAQPVAQGFSLNQIVNESANSLKHYITVENCIKGALVGAIAIFVGYIAYSHYKPKKNAGSDNQTFDVDYEEDGQLNPQEEPQNQDLNDDNDGRETARKGIAANIQKYIARELLIDNVLLRQLDEFQMTDLKETVLAYNNALKELLAASAEKENAESKNICREEFNQASENVGSTCNEILAGIIIQN